MNVVKIALAALMISASTLSIAQTTEKKEVKKAERAEKVKKTDRKSVV